MKPIDKNKEQGEKKLSIEDFLHYYNKNLPKIFPRATLHFLKEFRKNYPSMFQGENSWSLVQHRKKFMDWPRQRTKSSH